MELDSAWHNAPLEQKTYSGQLKLNYETVRHYVADIERGMQKIETSGTLSKTDLTDFKKAIHNNFVIQKKSLDWCKLPPSAKPVYDNPNIAILESNAKVHEENIAQAQKFLDEMQTPAQIQEIITKEHEELEQLKTAKKKDTKRIKALEDHAVQLGIAYGQAYSAEQRYKTDNLRQHARLNVIPAQIQQYKDLTDSKYKEAFLKKLADITTWIDFFDGKNAALYDFMRMLDAKTAMQKKLDDVVPMKETKSYQTRLDDFVGSWKL